MLQKFYTKETNIELLEDYKKADKFMLVVIFIHWLLVTTVSAYTYNTYLLGFVSGGLLFSISFITYVLYKGTPIMQIIVAIVLLTFTIISIQQHLGRIEMHFHVFIALAFLTIYKNFIPVSIAALYIAVHHLLFTYLQLHGITLFDTPIMIYNYGCGWDIAFLHAFYVIFEWIVLVVIVNNSRKSFFTVITYRNKLKDINNTLQERVNEKTLDLENKTIEMQNLLSTLDKNVITSETDENGIITYASEAFCKISGYTKEELIGQSHNILRHPDMDKSVFDELWSTITKDQTWTGEIKNKKKDGTFYWVQSIITPKCTQNKTNCGYTAVRYDITAQKALNDLTANLELKINERTADLSKAKEEIENIHKHTRDSIEYAAMIQNALISKETDLQTIFKDSFVYWKPKDTVGGDIWLFSQLRHQDECLLFFIDCTGHGVPGAFITMIVKSIEREIVANIKKHPEFDISPAIIMAHFNKTMKNLLKQDSDDTPSNAGWDGGIIYYNKRKQILKFAGAESSLYFIDKNNKLHTLKGNRHSVGYKKCDISYRYHETILTVEEGMKFYCTTDGYTDQNGGEKDFPLGKSRFKNIILQHYNQSMELQSKAFLTQLQKWKIAIENNTQNDDITIIGFEIDRKSDSKDDIITEIIKYEGVMTQNVIASAIDNLEAKISNIKLLGTISTITIEYCQNIMNYSKGMRENDQNNIVPAGTIEVQYVNDKFYLVIATNIISKEDKELIEPKLLKIKTLNKAELKKEYRELRKSGKNTHAKGGGIGLYEIAKVSDSIDYNFKSLNKNKFFFTMQSKLYQS